jgi:broad specificity phosphatase PhoE
MRIFSSRCFRHTWECANTGAISNRWNAGHVPNRTAPALAGFGAVAETDNDLIEWDYGAYEGRRSVEIHAERPDWQLFRDGCPGGECPAQVSSRAENVIKRIRAVNGNVLVFSSGHFIRVLAARWIGLEPSVHSTSFLLSTASLSSVGYEDSLSRPVVRLWNDTHHVSTR